MLSLIICAAGECFSAKILFPQHVVPAANKFHILRFYHMKVSLIQSRTGSCIQKSLERQIETLIR
jgi:hypothetical protein